MKAIQIQKYGDAGVLTVADTEEPRLRDNSVVIRNEATALNFIDTIMRKGELPDHLAPPLPSIPGVEGAGIIDEVADDVTGLKKGDRVLWCGDLTSGGYGEKIAISSDYVVGVPENLSFNQAAALPVNYMTAYHMLFNLGKAQEGDWVYVHVAAGGVGTAIVQLAKLKGLNIIASASTDKLDYVLEQGVNTAVDYKNDDVVAKVREATDDKGVALTLNPVSGDSIKADFEILAPFGTCICFGFLAGLPSGSFSDVMAQYFGKSIALRLSDIYTYRTNDPQRFKRDLSDIVALAEAGKITPIIYDTLNVKDASKGHQLIESGVTKGKVVFEVNF